MRIVFADNYYYLAFISNRDAGHARALDFSRTFHGRMLTTEWVLAEVADAMSAPDQRAVFVELLSQLRADPGLLIIEASHELFERGVALFSARSDKSWSLTDCISFVVMDVHKVDEALTADHHFEQAGYKLLLK